MATLDRLRRLREIQEQRAVTERLEAQRKREEEEAHLQHLQDQVEASRQASQDSGAAMALYQSYRVKAELGQRRQQARIRKASTTERQKEARVRHAHQQVALVDKLIELQDLREREEQRREENKELDTLGLSGWLRKAA